MDIVIQILFTALVSVGALLFMANVVVAALRLSHRPTQADRIARRLAPIASYVRLGGATRADYERSKHA